jgi:hypothetical protein
VVCFHDIGAWPGVTRFYGELMQSAPGYREVLTVGSIKVIQKQ